MVQESSHRTRARPADQLTSGRSGRRQVGWYEHGDSAGQVSVTIDLAKALDKAYEDKSLKDILDASPSALASVTEEDAAALEKAFNTKPSASSGRTSSSLSRRLW